MRRSISLPRRSRNLPASSTRAPAVSAAPFGNVPRPPSAVSLRVDWGLPTPGVALAPDEVHVALTLIERPVWPEEDLAELLAPEERAQAEKFRFEADRRRFKVCRGMLRLWLSRYLNVDPVQIEFVYGANGKPSVAGSNGDFHFNISHAGGLAAFAITRIGQVGIDIERVHDLPGWEQISTLCFAPEERARLAQLPEEERLQQFFRLWTRHEGWLKAWGAGLGSAPGAGDGDDAWARPGASGLLETFTPAPGYVATVAVLFPHSQQTPT